MERRQISFISQNTPDIGNTMMAFKSAIAKCQNSRGSHRSTMKGCWSGLSVSSAISSSSCKQHVSVLTRSFLGGAAWRASRQRLQDPCKARNITKLTVHGLRNGAGMRISCSCSDEASTSTSLFPPSSLQYRQVFPQHIQCKFNEIDKTLLPRLCTAGRIFKEAT